MTYVVERISFPDQRKVLRDGNSGTSISKVPSNIFDCAQDVVWAIDRDRDCYLLRKPTSAPEAGNEFLFWFQGVMYVVRVQPSAGKRKKTTVDLDYKPVAEPAEELKLELASVFATHGLFGRGPVGRGDGYNATFDVVPVFEQGA